ncbi:hypothetical protein GCM10009416_50210 [Craurococcus roseus]|uniref:Uncharacterized protein n=1 Tax=Craurococcus roseus TaxID=77585 RepID=A0ABP3RBD3_9PROT
MKVYVAHDGALRARIGKENLGSESLGPWYGGTGAIRLRQVHDGWFWAYVLDDHGYRGTAALPERRFGEVRAHIPSARVADDSEDRGRSLDVRVSDDDLRMLHQRVVPLRTRVARFGPGLAAMFGDFEIAAVAGSAIGLFHLSSGRFNAFTTGVRWAAMGRDGMPVVAARLPSARLRREGDMAVVEVDDADLATLLRMAGEER